MTSQTPSQNKANWTSSQLIGLREAICVRFEEALRSWMKAGGDRPACEGFLAEVPEEFQWEVLHCLLLLEEDYRREMGEGGNLVREFRARFPDFSSDIAQAFRNQNSPTVTQMQGDTEKGLPKRVREYELREKLGQGGMGTVWKAWHTRLKRYRAIKVLHSHMLENEDIRDRFLNEMEALARFEHPNIVRAHDAFEEGDELYLVMEYLEGEDVNDFVQQRGRLGVGAACEIIHQAAKGLAALHDQHVTHRDVKPGNLLLTRDSESNKVVVKVMDLGLSKIDAENRTKTDQIFGTYAFMAPEQWESCADAAPAVDVYALGCSLYCLLSGKPPYAVQGTPLKLALAHRSDPIPRIRDICSDGGDLQPLLNRMMAKKPEERYGSAIDLLKDIEPFADEEELRSFYEERCDTVSSSVSSESTESDIGTTARRRRIRRRTLLSLVSVVVLLGVAALIHPRVRVWLDPPVEAVVMPALSESHVIEDLPHLTPAMRLYLKDQIAWGKGRVGGVSLADLGSLLLNGDLPKARDELEVIHRYLQDRQDADWLAYGGAAYEVLLPKYEALAEAETPIDEVCAELDSDLEKSGPFASKGAQLHLRAILLDQTGKKAGTKAATSYYEAMEAYQAEGLRELAGIAALEYAKLLVKQNLVGSDELHDPSALLQHPEEYCDCRLFVSAMHSEAGRVHKLKGEYVDAIRKFDTALAGLGDPFGADALSHSGDSQVVPLSNPLPGYALRWKAFTELDRLRFQSAADRFEELWRKPPTKAATLENYLWGRQGEANALHYAGRHYDAHLKFQRLISEILGIDADNPKHPGGGDTVLDSVAVKASRRRLANIYERYADVYLYGRASDVESSTGSFRHDFGKAEEYLSDAIRYCYEEQFKIPRHNTFRIKYKLRIASLLKHLEESGPVPHEEFGPVLSPDEQNVKMEYEQELSFELEKVLANNLEVLCSGNDEEKAEAIDNLRQLFIRKGKGVDRKELGIRLVALEQILRYGDLDLSTLEELRDRLESIADRIDKAQADESRERSSFVTHCQHLLDTALAQAGTTSSE